MKNEKRSPGLPGYSSVFDKYQNIKYEKNGNIARIILNRPEKRNPLDVGRTIPEVNDAMSVAEWDDEIKAIIFKGAGDAFCSGYDLSEVGFMYGMKEPKPGEKFVDRPAQRTRLMTDRYMQSELHRHVMLCPKITIVQAHGYCIGGGLMVAEKCDFIFAADDCKFGFIEERLGGSGMTMSPLLILRVGLTKALELTYSGKMITGKEAERIGLINRAVPLKKLESEVEELAQAISLYPRDGIAISKVAHQTVYEMMGINSWFATAYWSHTLFTNLKWESGEFNFFKARRDKGVTKAAHEKHNFYKAFDK